MKRFELKFKTLDLVVYYSVEDNEIIINKIFIKNTTINITPFIFELNLQDQIMDLIRENANR